MDSINMMHLSDVLVSLVKMYSHLHARNVLGLDEVQQIATGLGRLGFNLSNGQTNAAVQRAVGILAFCSIEVVLI